jgi:hypothetical protein
MNSIGKKHSRWLAIALACGLIAGVCRADCRTSIFAFESVVVFYRCDRNGAPWLNIVMLDDGAALKVTGRVKTAIKRGIDAYAIYGDRLIVLSWDRTEIYDLKRPAAPTLAATFQLKNQGAVPGYPRIENMAGNRFLLLSTVGAAELAAEADNGNWKLEDVPRSPEYQRRMGKRPPEDSFNSDARDQMVVKETNTFRYELVWKSKTRPGESIRRQYLHKVEKATGRLTSALLMREESETID